MEGWQWEWLLDNEPHIKRAIRKFTSQRLPIEELWSEVVLERIERCFELYNPEHGNFLTYVKNTMYMYSFKYRNKSIRILNRFVTTDTEMLDVNPVHYAIDHDNVDWVQTILSGMSDYNAMLLLMYHVDDMTMQEIADELGCSKATVSNHYSKALNEAKDVQAGLS